MNTQPLWRVEHFEVSKEDSAFTAMRAIQHPEEFVPPGKYKRLMRGGTVVMSTTPMEERTHGPIIRNARGRVLLNGLGLGFVLAIILKNKEVKHVIVIELEPEVIRLVGPGFKSNPRVQIVQADAFAFQPPKGERYNAVWHDVWDSICVDNLPSMTRLKRKYAKRCDWQGCWAEAACRRNRWQ